MKPQTQSRIGRLLAGIPMRQTYVIRFAFRLFTALVCFLLYLFYPATFTVLDGWQFFRQFSPLHVVWLIWLINMLFQLIPTTGLVSSGSQKVFRRHFAAVSPKPSAAVMRPMIRDANRAALKVAAVWLLPTAAIAIARQNGRLGSRELFLLIVFFYVADLICVLFWCPFQRLLMKNRCCTTCRIFNWDHVMIMTPALFMSGFFTSSLLIVSLLILLVWETAFYRYPQRFLEISNQTLSCQFCKDHLCHQQHSLAEPEKRIDRRSAAGT